MKLLIDTHILLWELIGDERIGGERKALLEDPANEIYLSNVSLWEIAIKISIGKLKLESDLASLQRLIESKGVRQLPYDYEDLQTLIALPFIHQDPFDRLLVAQAKTKSFQIITDDKKILQYFE